MFLSKNISLACYLQNLFLCIWEASLISKRPPLKCKYYWETQSLIFYQLSSQWTSWNETRNRTELWKKRQKNKIKGKVTLAGERRLGNRNSCISQFCLAPVLSKLCTCIFKKKKRKKRHRQALRLRVKMLFKNLSTILTEEPSGQIRSSINFFYSKHLIGSISNSSTSFPEREAEAIYPEVHEVWGSLRRPPKSLTPLHIPSGPVR